MGNIPGQVYEEDGAPLRSASGTVRVQCLNPSTPYDRTVPIVAGSYLAPDVPCGAQYAFTATAPGYTTRTQVDVVLDFDPLHPFSVDFGGVSGNGGGDFDSPYFLSAYPEVTAVDPTDGATGVPSTSLSYSLTLSAPLDAYDQGLFANALRIFPASGLSDPTSPQAANLQDLNAVLAPNATGENTISATNPTGANATAYDYAIQTAATFMGGGNACRVAWDPDGQHCTLSFDAPLLTSLYGPAEYQCALVSDGQNLIRDGLGRNFGGPGVTAPLSTNELVPSVFEKAHLGGLISGSVWPGASAAWATTHENAATFFVATDTVNPAVTAFFVLGGNTFQMTFTTPMAVYAGSKAASGYGFTNDPTQYVFEIAQSPTLLDDITASSTGTVYDTFAAAPLNQAFELSGNAVAIAVDPANPMNLVISPRNASDRFNSLAHAVHLRIGSNVRDPAGRSVLGTNGANVLTGTF